MLRNKPEKIKQKAVAPLKMDGEIHAKKAICQFYYYLKDSRGKCLPRVYLCEHRTMADIFLESSLFDAKKNVLCIPKAEWESSPEEARQGLRKFEKVFKEPYQASQSFLRQLFRARQKGKSILLPVGEDARGMDRDPFPDAEAILRLCRRLEMPVCTVTFRNGQSADADTAGGQGEKTDFLNEKSDRLRVPGSERKGEQYLYSLDVRPLFTAEQLAEMSQKEMEAAVSESFFEEVNTQKAEDFRKRKRLRMREFLRSELNVSFQAEICQCHEAKAADGTDEIRMCDTNGIFSVDMTGITLEAAGDRLHRGPGALKSLAIYPGKKTETGERGRILIYPFYDKTFYLFTMENEEAENAQAAVEQMYEIVAAQ